MRQKPQKLALFFCKNHKNSRLFCSVFSAKTFSKPQKSCVRASKELLRCTRRVFGLRARSQSLARLVFGLWECSRGFPDTFSTFGSAPEDFPAHFRALGALPRLPLRSFTLWERSHAFSEAFSGFGCIPSHSSERFQPLGVFHRSALHCFVFRESAECSHRHCPRVARKSYKIFSSGG